MKSNKAIRILSIVALVLCIVMCFGMSVFADEPQVANTGNVAKVGNTEYSTIDEAIANWTNGTTLTLLADVTLSDVIQLSSTEYHILDLGTYTMTAASKKDAIQIVNNARSSASYTLDIKADATNPGGITATGKAVVRTAGKSGVKDRPIIRFYNGVFTGSYVVYHSGSNGTNCPQFQFHGGEFNGTIYTNRALNQFYGGTFTGSLQMSVDSSAYTLIAGGTFKKLSNLYMSALNSGKFTIGSAKGVYDKEVYVDDNGNFVIAATEPSEGIEAGVAKTPGTNDYLAYSKVATEGALNYTDVYVALENNKTATVTVFVDELDLAGSSFTGTIVVPEGQTLTITNAPEGLKTEGEVAIVKPVATIGTVGYMTLQDAINAAQNGDTITLLTGIELDAVLTITKSITIDGNSNKITQSASCTNTYALLYFDANDVLDITIKNVTFDGIKGGAVIRTLGANMTIDNCVFQNCEHTQVQGLVRLTQGKASITNTKFINNNCSMVVTFNYDTAGLEGDTFLVDNCVFEGNTANGTAAIYYVKGAGCTITNSDFTGNKVNCNSNGATIYLGFQEDCVVTGNIFENNVVNDSSTSTRVAGAIFFGYEAEISGNVFKGNTATNASGDTLGQVCTSTYYDCTIDLSGNYWGGEAPVYGVDYTVQHQTGDSNFELDNYYEVFAVDAAGNVVLDQTVEIDYVAQVGKFKYTNIGDAIAAANGDTITILDNITITETIRILAGKIVTIDLNGKTIDGIGNVRIAIMSYGDLTIKDSSDDKTGIIKAGIGTAGNAINICAGTFTFESGNVYSLNNAILVDEQAAEITIKGGNIVAEPTTKNSAVFYISSTSDTVVNITGGTLTGYNGILLWNNTELNISGGSIIAEGGVGIQGNGSKDNTKISISGDTSISGYYAAIYHPQGGELNISGGTLTGWSGVVVKGGKVTISGGKITATGTADTYRPVSSGYVDTGDALYIEHYDNSTNSENYGTPVVIITGGIFESANGKAVASYANPNNSVEALKEFISGGTFDEALPEEYCANGFIPTENADGTFGVKVGSYVAEVNGVKYENLQDAIVAACPGGTVTLLTDVTVEKWIMITQSLTIGDGSLITVDEINGLTIDGDGHTLTINSVESAKNGNYLFFDATNLNVKDLTINCAGGFGGICLTSGTIDNVTFIGGGSAIFPGAGDITITGCTFKNNGAAIYFETDRDNLVVTGNTFNLANTDSYAIYLRGAAKFTDNIVLSGKVNVTNSSTGEISGNDFNDVRFKVYNGATAIISNNTINYLVFNDATPTKATFKDDNILSDSAQDALDAVTPKVAEVNGVEYATLADAFAAAQDGDTITLLKDINLDTIITNTKKVTLDLCGKTITGTDNTEKNFSLIDNRGELTITGNGKMTLTATINSGWNRYSAIIANNPGGKLIIESGTIEHLGGTDMAYGIDNLTNGKGTYAETIINGGTIKSTYRAIRQFLNGIEAQNILTINGGTIEGTNKAIWMQDPSKNANTGSLTVNENATIKGDIYLTVTAGSTEWPVEVAINANAIADGYQVLTSNVPEGYELENVNGIYGVITVSYVAEVNGTKYETLAEAIANANGSTVTLLEDVTLTEALVVNGTVTLDLAGYTVVYNSTTQGEAMITNKGNLTINDSVGTGVINYNYTGAADPSYGKGNYTISNQGTLTVNGGKITIANLSSHAKYPIDNNSTTGDAILVINGGHLYNYNTSAIRMFCNSTVYKNSVTINGGLVEGYCAIWVQNPGKNTVNGSLTITDGEIKSTAKAYVNGTANLEDVSSAIYFTISANGGAWSADSAVTITGGIFNENVYLLEDAPEMITVDEEAATFNGYVELPVSANAETKIGDTYYATFAEALAAAKQNGGTIVLLRDVELDAVALLGGTVLDLNGNTVTTKSFVVFKSNAIVDNGTTKGMVKVDKYAFAVLDSSNHMIPVWTGEGYILAEVKDQYQVEVKGEDSFSVTMRPSISGGGITTSDIFKDGALDNGITIKLNIHCHTDGEEEIQVVSVIVNEEFIKQAYSNDEALLFTIRGAGDIYDHYMVEIEIVSEAGVSDKCVIGVFSNGNYYETVDAFINASEEVSEEN